MIPFFVVDRPVSLEILKGIFFKFPQLRFGLMTHANVSPNFVQVFQDFPYSTKLKYSESIVDEKRLNEIIHAQIIKISDSGVFQKNGSNRSYPDLFNRYIDLGVQFGIIKDVLHNMKSTLKSAKEGIEIYQELGFYEKFNLIGVAQGKTVEEYIRCYEKLLDMGYEYIAIGGLLRRNGNSNYVQVRSEEFLKDVVGTIQKEFSPKWLFVLGVYSPKRHQLLENLGVWGADYKGWLFHYDEYYSKSIQEFLEYPDVKNAYKQFIRYKNNFRESRTPENRKKFWEARKKLDEVLKSHGTSLQELRFREVRATIRTSIISQMKL
ncbi:hypothetical protein [Thermococcus thermotolerans]|uniref:hypothetical protein n=1 Tax=Thermococcus thermotolerans TaxID=2969672 RepID=UPI002158987F|nr:hypothetical protein [Thermococcus thermotolerans]